MKPALDVVRNCFDGLIGCYPDYGHSWRTSIRAQDFKKTSSGDCTDWGDKKWSVEALDSDFSMRRIGFMRMRIGMKENDPCSQHTVSRIAESG